ncbi:MAG: hypothetical protein IPL70_12450 [Uliginosibacterium sp.]|nr:hypothetical protein [Uliginosibacterium sp.]
MTDPVADGMPHVFLLLGADLLEGQVFAHPVLQVAQATSEMPSSTAATQVFHFEQ